VDFRLIVQVRQSAPTSMLSPPSMVSVPVLSILASGSKSCALM
jgi:hypothetical protein